MFSVRSLLQLILVSCIVTLLAHSAECKPQLYKKLIYYQLDIEDVEFTIQLRDDNSKFFCAGTLISNEFVVTAAECFKHIDYSKAVVVAGAKTLTEDGVQRQIAKVTIHPDFDVKTNFANVAVLKLKDPLETSVGRGATIRSIPLSETEITEFAGVEVFGWRHMSESHAATDTLYGTRLGFISQDKCNNDYNATTEHGLFCLQGKDYDDQYTVSDLGGPGVCRAKLCGIASSCTKCGDIDYTNSFTDVYYYRDFIYGAMV